MAHSGWCHIIQSKMATKYTLLSVNYKGLGAWRPSTWSVRIGSWLIPGGAQLSSPVDDQCIRWINLRDRWYGAVLSNCVNIMTTCLKNKVYDPFIWWRLFQLEISYIKQCAKTDNTVYFDFHRAKLEKILKTNGQSQLNIKTFNSFKSLV